MNQITTSVMENLSLPKLYSSYFKSKNIPQLAIFILLGAFHLLLHPNGYASPGNPLSDDCQSEEVFSEQSPMAALQIPGKGLYVFRGDEYYKYQYIGTERTLLAGYPKKLPGGWKGLPESFQSGIDAAVYYPPTKKTYLFKGNKYLRITGVQVDDGFPKRLPGGWSGLPATFAKDIDAAMYYEGEEGKKGHIILVKGNKYVSFSNFKIKVLNGNVKDLWGGKQLPGSFNTRINAMAQKDNAHDRASPGTWLFSDYCYMSAPGTVVKEAAGALVIAGMEPVAPSSSGITLNTRSIMVWGEVKELKEWQIKKYNLKAPDRTKIAADASVYIPEVGSYIFNGDQYYKYSVDLAGKKKPKLWKDYPRKLPGGWKGLPKSFQSGIDAAFYMSSSKKTYLLKGKEYVRLTGVKVDAGYPKPLKGNFKGIPTNFQSDIDAAFVLGANQKAYVVLVKNGYFVAFLNSSKVASGKIKNLWKGLPAGFNREVTAVAHGGFWGNYLFSGEQVLFYPGHVAKLNPQFSVNEVPNYPMGDPSPVDDWQLVVKKRKKKTSAEGSHHGLTVKLLPPSATGENEKNKIRETTENQDKNYDCSIKHYNEKLTSPENILLDPTTDVIFPGAIIDGSSIPTGEYKLLNVARNNYTVSTRVNAKKGSATITDPLKISHVRESVNSIIRTIPTAALSGKLSFQAEEMYSEQHFRLKFGGHYNTGAVNISSGLDISSSTKKHRLVIEFVQEFFTIDMDNVGTYKNWIKDPSKINFYETIPMYVASIKYGRRAYMSVESDESISSLKTYFSGKYMAAGAKLSTEQKRILKTSKVKVYIVGGDGKNAAGAATGDYKKFMQYIEKGTGTALTAMPIAYKLRFLENNAVAKVSLSSNYTVRNCTAYQTKWRVHLNQMICTGVDDSGGNEELYGMAWVDFYDKNGNQVNKNNNKIWHRKVDEYVSLTAGGTFTIDKAKEYVYSKAQLRKDKKSDKGAYIILRGWIEEDDDSSGNDDLGRMEKKIYLNEITNGRMDEIVMDGFADGGSRAKMTWTIETF